jgi:zinc protease
MKGAPTGVVLTLLAFCLQGKEIPPVGTAPKPFKLAVTDDYTLPNGLKVTLAPYGVVPKVSVRAYVDAGRLREPADKTWLASLTADLLKEGTKNRSAEQIAQEAADMGGSLQLTAGDESVIAGGSVLSENGPQFVALLADVLQRATLPDSEVARLKTDLVRQLQVTRSQPKSLARERFFKTMFPDQPYGRLYPSSEALSGYTIADVRSFFDANYTASRTHLYVVGKFNAEIKDAIKQAFTGWKSGTAAPLPSARPVSQYSLQQVERPGAAQSTIYAGLPVAGPKSPDYMTLDVMDSLLGSAFASRITSNIREAKGYSYSPASILGEAGHQSYWVETADVTTAVTGPSLREIFAEVNRLRKEAPSAQELRGIRNYLSGVFVLKNTISPDAIISQLHWVDSQELDRSFLSTYVQKVNAVEPQDVQRVAETYINPAKMTVVVVGDKSKIADQLKAFEAAP